MTFGKIRSVVLFPEDKRLEIIDPRLLEGYTRKWNDSSSLWPETCVFMSDDDEDQLCKLLFLGGEY